MTGAVTVSRPVVLAHGLTVLPIFVAGVRVGEIRPAVDTQGRYKARSRGWNVYLRARSTSESESRLYWAPTAARAVLWARQYSGWPITRYVALSGSQGGYMQDYTGCCDSRDVAILDLCELHQVSPRGRMARELRAQGYSTRVPASSGYGTGRGTSLGGLVEVTKCACPGCAGATLDSDTCSDCSEWAMD